MALLLSQVPAISGCGARPTSRNGWCGGRVDRKSEPSGRTLSPSGLSVFREHRFVVVVWERIVEPGFDDRLDGFRRVSGGIHPHVGFPQSEVAQDALDDVGIVDEGDDPHFVLAARTQERVGFPDFLDEFAPLL